MRKIAKITSALLAGALASCGAHVACASGDEVLIAEFEHHTIYITDEQAPDCPLYSYSAYRVDEEGDVTFGCWTLTPERTAVEVTWPGRVTLVLQHDQLSRAPP